MANLNEISKLFTNPCNYLHTNCRLISQKIADLHNKKLEVTNDFFSSYLQYLENSEIYYYDKCSNRKDICMQVICDMLKYIIPTEEDMVTIANFFTNRNNDNMQRDIYQCIINKKIPLSTSMLYTTIKNHNIYGAMILINHINPDSKCLERACLCTNADKLINLIISQKIPITITAMKNAITANNNNAVSLMMQIGILPDYECLNEACMKLNLEIINKILMYKIIPTKQCFISTLSSCSLGYGKDRKSLNSDIVADVIDCLVRFGYQLTYEDVLYALLRGCYIRNIKRFNIKFEPEFMQQCAKLNYYPYDDIGVGPTMECFYTESKRIGNVAGMKKLISKGLTPDVTCLVHACDNKTNLQNIKFLVEQHKIKPNLDCLKMLSKHIKNSTLKYLLEHFEDSSDQKEIQDDIIDDINDIDENDENDISDDMNTIDNIIDNSVENTMTKEEIEFMELIKNNKLLNDIHMEIIEDQEFIKKTKYASDDEMNARIDSMMEKVSFLHKNREKIMKKKINEIVYDIVTIDIVNFQKVNKKHKYQLDDNIIKLFDLEKVNSLTFSDIRKLLLNYINFNNLIDSNRKNLIKVNNDLAELLNINTGQYFDFKDIDNVVYKLLNL